MQSGNLVPILHTNGALLRVTTRRALLGALAGSLLGAQLIAAAQQSARGHRIGYLAGGSATGAARFHEAFRHALRELGWVEGQNIAIESRFADGMHDRLPNLAAELIRLNVHVIIAGPSPAAVAAKKATTSIPIIMAGVGFPVELGLVASLGRPGGNVSGVAFSAGLELFGKGLELLKEVTPKMRRVAVFLNPASPGHAIATQDVKSAAGSIGVQLLLLDIAAPAEMEGAFATMAKERVAAVLVVPDPLFLAHRERLTTLVAKSRLPAVYSIREFADAGGLMSYGPSLVAQYRRAAVFVDKILRGAKPGELPVEQPTQYEMILNLKTAKALGVTFPPSLLSRADEVIQ